MLKREVKCLVLLCVLEKLNEHEWGAPTFYQQKKYGLQILSDFRNLNGNFIRKPYPMNKISEL